MLFRELNRGKCKTYLIGSETDHVAVLVDPIREKVDRYLALLAYQGLRLEAVIDTHTHADHRTASATLKSLRSQCYHALQSPRASCQRPRG